MSVLFKIRTSAALLILKRPLALRDLTETWKKKKKLRHLSSQVELH